MSEGITSKIQCIRIGNEHNLAQGVIPQTLFPLTVMELNIMANFLSLRPKYSVEISKICKSLYFQELTESTISSWGRKSVTLCIPQYECLPKTLHTHVEKTTHFFCELCLQMYAMSYIEREFLKIKLQL